MFGTIKKAMVIAAIAGVGAAAAPAMASAGLVFNTDATSTEDARAAHGIGQLTLTVNFFGADRTTTCDVTVTADLWNGSDAGTVRGLGEVTTFLLGSDIGPDYSCTTSIPGCTLTMTADTTSPWGIATSAPADATISGIALTWVYSGGVCPVNGLQINATGSVTGQVTAPGLLEFANASGLTTSWGPATVDGEVELLWEDDDAPVEVS